MHDISATLKYIVATNKQEIPVVDDKRRMLFENNFKQREKLDQTFFLYGEWQLMAVESHKHFDYSQKW